MIYKIILILAHLRLRDRNIDVPDTKMPERINHRIHDRRRRANRRRLTNTFRTERMMRRRRTSLVSFPVGRLDRRWQKVIHKTALQNVTALVVLNLFVKRRTESHRQATMNLSFDDHRIDDVAAIIDGYEPAYLDLACTLIDIDDADVAAEWIREIWRIVVVDCFEPGFHSGRMIRVGCE